MWFHNVTTQRHILLSECDSCVHLLLDDMDYLHRNITMMMSDLESVSVGVRTVRRLEEIKKAVNELGVRLQPW